MIFKKQSGQGSFGLQFFEKIFRRKHGNGRLCKILRVPCDDEIDFRAKRCFDHHSVLEIGYRRGNGFAAVNARSIQHVEEGKEFVQCLARRLVVMGVAVHEIVNICHRLCGNVAEEGVIRCREENILRVYLVLFL